MLRYRFVDDVRAISLDEPSWVEVAKTFPPGDDVFSGPGGEAAVPGTMLLELVTMAGGWLVLQRLEWQRLPLLMKVPECRFHGTAAPGEALTARARLRALSTADPFLAEVAGDVTGSDGLLAEARLIYLCFAVPGLDLAAARPAP